MAQQDDLNVGRIALISLVSGLVLVATILFLQVLYYWYYQGMMASPQYDQLPAEMTNYVADQQGKLVTIRVVDKEREIVTIPIDDAERLVIDELSADPQAHVTGVPDPEQPPPPEEGEATGDQPPTADTPKEGNVPADNDPTADAGNVSGQPDDATTETESPPPGEPKDDPPDDTPPAPADPAAEATATSGGGDEPADELNNPTGVESPPTDKGTNSGEEVRDEES